MTSQADVSEDTSTGTTTTVISDQSISPGQKAVEVWTHTQKKADGYYQQAHNWYTEHNTPVRVIPELAKVNQLDLLLTVFGIVIAAWMAMRFFFGR